MTNILVTGGAGFLGSHLCKVLIEKGHRVTALDNLYTGSLQNINSIDDHRNFKFIQKDVRIPFNFKNDFDEIYNLAIATDIPYKNYVYRVGWDTSNTIRFRISIKI